LGQGDTIVSLAAPAASQYLVLVLGIEPAGPAPSTLHLTERPGAPAHIRLALGKAGSGIVMSPLGRPADPPDRLVPFEASPLRLRGGSPAAEIALAFLVPADATTVTLLVGTEAGEEITLRPPEPTAPDAIVGTWHKSPGQMLHLRYPDPIADALCSRRHRVLSVRRLSPSGWLFEFPFSGVTAGPAQFEDDDPLLGLDLTHGTHQRQARVRLVDGGDVLILYLGGEPAERLVYRRAEP
jgi:hypothetical protein